MDQTSFVLSMTGIWHSDGGADLLILSIDLKALIHRIKIPSWQITDQLPSSVLSQWDALWWNYFLWHGMHQHIPKYL